MRRCHYFAYGSNMFTPRIGARIGSARVIGVAALSGHVLRFHKRGRDGSGKGDAFWTGNGDDLVRGVLFEVTEADMCVLDRHEGRGNGYAREEVRVEMAGGASVTALTYQATWIDPMRQPYHWYKHHVLAGAREHGLPEAYIGAIAATPSLADPVATRQQREMAIHHRPGLPFTTLPA